MRILKKKKKKKEPPVFRCCSPFRVTVHGQLYLLIGWYLLLTKYTAVDLIIEVQYTFSSAIGDARAFIVTVQVL